MDAHFYMIIALFTICFQSIALGLSHDADATFPLQEAQSARVQPKILIAHWYMFVFQG